MRSLTATWLSIHRDPQPSEIEEEVTALFHEFRSPLLRYAMSMGVGLSDGEDVVQEVFLALYRHLCEGKPRTNLRGWIFRVGHNLVLKRRSEHAFAEVGEVVESKPNPEQMLASNRRSARLVAAVSALPERDRFCLFLKMEGLRYREIAEVLDMSLGAVAISLSRSLGKLTVVRERDA